MLKPCPVCRSRKRKLFLKTKECSLYSCRSCNLIYISPSPTKQDIKKLYRQGYYLRKDIDKPGYRDYEKQKSYFLPYFKKKFDKISKLLSGKKGRLLDIGCAFGFFLEIVKNKGWDVTGLDISPYAANVVRKKGIKAKSGEFSKVKFDKDSFDVVTAFQTIEHILEPVKFLEEVKRVLKSGGFVVLTTPDIKGVLPSLLGEKWFGWKNEAHLLHFSKENLAFLLKKAGFKNIRIKTDTPIWVSLEEIAVLSYHHYPNWITRVLNNVVQALPGRLKNLIFIPQVGVQSLVAYAEK